MSAFAMPIQSVAQKTKLCSLRHRPDVAGTDLGVRAEQAVAVDRRPCRYRGRSGVRERRPRDVALEVRHLRRRLMDRAGRWRRAVKRAGGVVLLTYRSTVERALDDAEDVRVDLVLHATSR